MSLIGKKVPSFNVQAIKNDTIRMMSDKDLLGQYSVIFFYPLDFTFVCPTEIHALQSKIQEFTKRNTQVYAVSVDSIHSHRAWLNTPKNDGGIQGIEFSLVSDIHRTLTNMFNVLDEDENVSLRGTFILDKDNVVQHATVNNLSFGRNIDEIIRMIDAISFVEENGDYVCPANWNAGEETMVPTDQGVKDYLRK